MSSNPYAPPSTDAAGPDRFVDQSDRVRLLSTLLLIRIAADVITIVSSALALDAFTDAKAGRFLDEAEADAADLRSIVVFVVYLGTLVATAIVFGKFLIQTNRNARALGHAPLGYSPGSMMWWFFVPIANLWKPYAAVREVWFASARGPASAEPRWGTLQLWWAMWVISSILSNISFRMEMRSESIQSSITSTSIDIVACVMEIMAALLARSWIVALNASQQRTWAEKTGQPAG